MYRIGKEEIDELARVIETRSMFKINQGLQETYKVEEKLRKIFGVEYPIFLTSGQGALSTALVALGIGPGDQVIVPAYTYISTAMAVVDAGVKTCGTDQGMPVPYNGCASEIVASEEHFQIHNYTEKTVLGEKILLVPAHCCSTVNLYDKIYLVDGDTVVDRISITAKGIGR